MKAETPISYRGEFAARARPTVLIADDHMIVLEGIKKLMEPHFEVVGCVCNGRDVIAAAANAKPRIVLLDISMPEMSGIQVARQLKAKLPETKIIFLTVHRDLAYVRAAVDAGGDGYVVKSCAFDELVKAINQVLGGKLYVTPEVDGYSSTEKLRGERSGASLTVREQQVLQLVAKGNTGKEIAVVLKISPKTVAFHKAGIMSRLGLHTTADLTRFSISQGLLDD